MVEVITIKLGKGSIGLYTRVVHEICDRFKSSFSNNKTSMVTLYFVNKSDENNYENLEINSFEMYYRSLLRLRDSVGRFIGIVETACLDAYRLPLLLLCDYVISYSDTKIQFDSTKEIEIVFNRILYSIPPADFPLDMCKLYEHGFVHELFDRKHDSLCFNENSQVCINPILAGLIRKLVDNAEQIGYAYKQIGIATVYANTVCVTQFVSPLKMYVFHPYTTVMSSDLANRKLEIKFNGPLKFIHVRTLSAELAKLVAAQSSHFDSIHFTFDAAASDSDMEKLSIGSYSIQVNDFVTSTNVFMEIIDHYNDWETFGDFIYNLNKKLPVHVTIQGTLNIDWQEMLIALCSSNVTCSTQATLYYPSNLNQILPGSVTLRLVKRIGVAWTKSILLNAQKLDGFTLVKLGLFDTAKKISAKFKSVMRKEPSELLEWIRNNDAVKYSKITEPIQEILDSTKLLPYIVGVSTAFPENHIEQEKIADYLSIPPDHKIRTLFTSPFQTHRYLAGDTDSSKSELFRTQRQLLEKHLHWSVKLGNQAILAVCEQGHIDVADIGFLMVVQSCGFQLPPLSAHLSQSLKLSRFVAREDIVGMGCHAGLNGLRSTSYWCLQNPTKYGICLLVEISSAQVCWPDKPTIEIALVHSLFGDGCAAALIRSGQPQDIALDNRFGICPILGWESYVVPDSLHLMYTHWYESADTAIDSRFLFVSTRELSYAVGIHLPIMINSFLNRFHLTISDITHWVIHSGGSKVNESVIYNLGLDHYHLRMTSKTIKYCGNIASASFLVSFGYLLEELNEKQTCNRGDLGVFLTMGPGAGFECALFII